jgi:putative peptide zinc metalloprotease protein
MGDVVDPTNAAVAYASCTDCQTIAVAIQVVFIMDDASTITPENVAIAINELCTLCETMASAYQFVITTGGPVRFTDEGQRRLREVLAAFHDLEKRAEDMTLEEIDAEIQALVDEIAAILATELVPAGDSSTAEETPSPAASPSSVVSPSPTESTVSPTPTVEPTSTITVSPDPSPSPAAS